MKVKKYKAVIIGCGRIGAEELLYPKNIRPATHAAAYLSNAKIELAGLCDISTKKLSAAKKLFPNASLYISAEKMLREIKPDIVSIATHPEMHAQFVKMAADFGVKAIICEKPIAESIRDAESMVKKCKEKKSFLFIAHLRHFDPLIGSFQKKIQKGVLGAISQVSCFYHNGFLNNGTHMIDVLRWFLGEVEWVSGNYNYLTSNPKKDKNIDALISFKNGSRAALKSVTEKTGLTEWSFHGGSGVLEIKERGIKIIFKNSKKGKPRSLISSMISHAVACLDGEEEPLSTGEDGLRVLKILLAVKKSAENAGKNVKM